MHLPYSSSSIICSTRLPIDCRQQQQKMKTMPGTRATFHYYYYYCYYYCCNCHLCPRSIRMSRSPCLGADRQGHPDRRSTTLRRLLV